MPRDDHDRLSAPLEVSGSQLRNTGIELIGDAPWGTHFCHFYETKADLADLLVPYFSAGLRNNEFCMWVTSEPLGVADAEMALRKELPELDDCIKKQQIEILDYSEWYTKGGSFDADRVLEGWVEKARSAVERGFDGLRLTGNTFWLEERDWRSFAEYEATVNNVIGQHPMIALCSYALEKCGPHEFMDVVHNHQFALVKREGEWELLASPALQQARQALLEERARSEGRWERTFDAVPDLIAILDEHYHVVRANRAMAQRLGVTADECVGKVCFEVVHGTDRPPAFCPHAPSLRDGRDHTAEVAEPRLGGEFIVTVTPLVDDQGKRLGSVHVARDITERKLAEETLRRHREDLSHAQAVAHIGSWRLDVRRNELTWSDENHRIFGIPEGTPMTYEAFLATVHSDDREYVDQEWTAALRGEPYDIEHRIVVGDTVKWVRERAELEFDEQGTLLGGFGTTQDITERKQAEEALERLRTEFMGMVTHELKTPLTAIKGSAATALGSRRPLAAEENRELFQIIDEQSDRLRELMDNLLDATRIEAGTLAVSPEPTDLRDILEEARAIFARGGGRHEIQFKVPADMPRVNADRRRIIQVLANLLNNAAAFSSATEPITIGAEHNSEQVTVQVRDRGRGIAKEKLALLFKKFSRLHDDAGQRLSGTGLGLAICKGIVEAHGGRIWADSAGESQGSTFSFTLPVASEVSAKALSDEARRAMHLGRVRRPTEKTRVLAVDDEPQILRYLRRSLDEAGYQPILTADPCEVAKLVELEEPDLVLLDLVLPGTSGFELLQRIREFSGVPVIFLTASDREEDAVRALKEGADDYITKPFSPSELLARIEAALRRRLLPDMLEARPPFTLGDLMIDFVERRVTVGGQEVALSATEYKILYELATHAGRPLSYEQLLRQVWGPEYSSETELVRSFIRNLRRKLGDDAQNPRFILTERQVGYRMPKP